MEKMKIEYLDGNAILTYVLDENEEIDNLSSEMLKNRNLKEFLPMSFTQMDSQRYLSYDVTGLSSISDIFKESGNFKKLYHIFTGIIDALNMVDEYMLVKESVMLDDNYIFADMNYETKMVCLPIKGIDNNNPDIRRFFKNILIDYQFDETDERPYIRRVVNYLNSEDFNLDGLKKLLKVIQTENMGAVQKKVTGNAVPVKEEKQSAAPIQNVINETERKPKDHDIPVVFEYNPESDDEDDDVLPADENEKYKGEQKQEEKMSLMYLLHNFSGENLKKYKESNKKDTAAKGQAQKKAKENKDAKKAKKAKAADMNFARPGKEEHLEMNFNIPGRENKKSEADVLPVVNEAEKNAEKLIYEARTDLEQKKQSDVHEKESLYSDFYNVDFEQTIALTDDYDDDEATVVLNENQNIRLRPSAYLVRKKTGEKIFITADSFSLGKQSSEVDYCISNNATISRCHCFIKFEDGTFYLVDNGAKNFTYVNGERLISRGKSPIKTGDTIRLSNENFEFTID